MERIGYVLSAPTPAPHRRGACAAALAALLLAPQLDRALANSSPSPVPDPNNFNYTGDMVYLGCLEPTESADWDPRRPYTHAGYWVSRYVLDNKPSNYNVFCGATCPCPWQHMALKPMWRFAWACGWSMSRREAVSMRTIE